LDQTVGVPTPEDLVDAASMAGVRDARLLDAIRMVPRDRFVPPALSDDAYYDEPVPIPHGQVTSQPSLIARMVEALDLDGNEKVLEVGTGYGWQTAILARLARTVWSIEWHPDIAEAARRNLERLRVANAHVIVGDGTRGLPDRAPFDAIVVSAAFPEVPGPLAEQLALGGRLVQPLGPGGDDLVVRFERRPEGLERTGTVVPARFVRLLGRYGFSR
jgi:protein-L-isoaspartate(D-aspartate) O-methyltransferase